MGLTKKSGELVVARLPASEHSEMKCNSLFDQPQSTFQH